MKERSLPSTLPRPEAELDALERAWKRPRGWRILKSVNNTHIGLFYIATALLFFLLAGVLALAMRAQLAVPDNDLLSPQRYNQFFTMHGTVMMFLFAVPVVEAIAVYLLPGMTGARDLPFPRLGAYAFWAYCIGGLAFFATLFFGVAPDGGWFMYPPLTGAEHSPGLGADFWLLGIGFIEISAIAGAIELIIGILFTRAPGMSLSRMPVFAWAMLVVGFMIVFAFPAVIAGTLLLEMERAFDWPFFIPARGGDPLLWQHLFWFFGHPEVYIIFLPAAGLVSMMIPALARTRLVGYRAIVWALIATGAVSFALWAHHMFTAGLSVLSMTLVSAASMAIAVPAGMQVFSWIATLWKGRLQINGASLFVLGFLFIFVLGGLTGVMVAALPFDTQAHDTYFIVAHLHYVLVGGMVFPLFAALYFWTPFVNGHRLSERVARWVFGLMFIGFNVAFFPMHASGLMGMPRRVYTYAADAGLSGLNLVSTLGAFMFAAGVLLFFIDALRTWPKSSREHGNPWSAPTLEWVPNGDFGTRSIAQVESRDPIWDRPSLPKEIEAGQHWLPGTTSGRRETLITSPREARLWHLVVLPGDSWLPLLAGLGTAGFFLLLTVKMLWTASACGIVAVVAIWIWLWGNDNPPHRKTVQVGDGVFVPVNPPGRRSHSWWATAVLVVVDLTIWASLLFAHLHVSMNSDVCPPAGARLPALSPVLLSATMAVAGSLLLAWLQCSRLAPAQAARASQFIAIVLALLAACASMAFAWEGHAAAGLDPRAQAWSATVAALLAWQGLHALILALMAIYLAARLVAGRLTPDSRATLDNTALFWHGCTLQTLGALAVVQLLPSLMPW